MLKSLHGYLIPNLLQGPYLIESTGLPRFWITVWSFYSLNDLAITSQIKQLRYIEAFYTFSEQLKIGSKSRNHRGNSRGLFYKASKSASFKQEYSKEMASRFRIYSRLHSTTYKN